jgi:cardiolipin synthase
MADANPLPATPPLAMTVEGNRLSLLPDGPERLDALIALIEGAERTLRVLYYMFLDDAAGARVRDALIAAAERGVKVWLLVDGFGSDGAKAEFFDPLVRSKVGFCRFSAKYGRRYLLRNHQKLALADETHVITGGFNISDDYFGTMKPAPGGTSASRSKAKAFVPSPAISTTCSNGRKDRAPVSATCGRCCSSTA